MIVPPFKEKRATKHRPDILHSRIPRDIQDRWRTTNGDDSHSFQTYLKWAGVKHKKVSAEDPELNRLAENFMKNLKKVWHIALQENKNPQQEMYKFLRQYRATPHCTTGKGTSSDPFRKKILNQNTHNNKDNK